MFAERYFIVITGLRVPLMPYEPADYFPSWVEWSIFAAGVAFFSLLITLAMKLFPMLAVWEIVEEKEAELALELAEDLIESGTLTSPGPRGDSESRGGGGT